MLALKEGSRERRSSAGLSMRPREDEVEARGAAGESNDEGRAWEMLLARTWVRSSGKREVRVARRREDLDGWRWWWSWWWWWPKSWPLPWADVEAEAEAAAAAAAAWAAWAAWEAEAAMASWAAALSDEAGAPEAGGRESAGWACWEGLDWGAAGGNESAGGSSAVLTDI